jgi:excisionase family DNA binding protein
MEKICIVKRRREYTQTEVKLLMPDNLNDAFPQAAAASNTAIDTRPEFPSKIPDVKLVEPEKLYDRRPPAEVAISSDTIDVHTELSDKKQEFNITRPDNLIDNLPSEIAISSATINNEVEFSDNKLVEEFTDKSVRVISITMTKEQSTLLMQSEYIKELLSGAKSDPAMDIKLTPDGRISLNYHFSESMIIRMLSPNQVCQMLQISRSFLQKIIHENKLKSYKLGRMRRFLLEDILEYLSNDVEIPRINT